LSREMYAAATDRHQDVPTPNQTKWSGAKPDTVAVVRHIVWLRIFEREHNSSPHSIEIRGRVRLDAGAAGHGNRKEHGMCYRLTRQSSATAQESASGGSPQPHS